MVTFGSIEYGPSEKQRRFKARLELHNKIIADLCEAGDFEEAIKTSLRRPAYDGDTEKMGKELESRVKKEQILLSHEFLNAQIFHSSIDCRQKTYLIHMLRKDRSIIYKVYLKYFNMLKSVGVPIVD